jgi:hypothetical protein
MGTGGVLAGDLGDGLRQLLARAVGQGLIYRPVARRTVVEGPLPHDGCLDHRLPGGSLLGDPDGRDDVPVTGPQGPPVTGEDDRPPRSSTGSAPEERRQLRQHTAAFLRDRVRPRLRQPAGRRTRRQPLRLVSSPARTDSASSPPAGPGRALTSGIPAPSHRGGLSLGPGPLLPISRPHLLACWGNADLRSTGFVSALGPGDGAAQHYAPPLALGIIDVIDLQAGRAASGGAAGCHVPEAALVWSAQLARGHRAGPLGSFACVPGAG